MTVRLIHTTSSFASLLQRRGPDVQVSQKFNFAKVRRLSAEGGFIVYLPFCLMCCCLGWTRQSVVFNPKTSLD